MGDIARYLTFSTEDLPAGSSERVGMDEWSGAIDTVLLWLAAGGARPQTLRLRNYQLHRLARSVTCGPWEIQLSDLLKFLANHDWSPNTRRSHRSAVKVFCEYGVTTGLLASDPSTLLPAIRVPRGEPRPVPEGDVVRAMAATDSQRDRTMILLGRFMGLRRAEIASVHTRDIVDGVLYVTGKGGTTRRVPVPPELLEIIAQRPEGYLFPGKIDGHLSPDRVGRILKTLLRNYHGHQLRHSFFSVAHGRGVDLMTLTRLGGWASTQTAMVYTQTPDQALRDAVLAAGT